MQKIDPSNDLFVAQSILGNQVLNKELEKLGESSPLTKLHVELDSTNPDEAFSQIPYEKGYQFIYYLESKYGEDNL